MLIDISGACDLHIHSAPDLFPRLTNDIGIVKEAEKWNMGAIIIKSHVESTVSRAFFAQTLVENNLKVFGGVALNSYVGGFNPDAVEANLRLGAKQIWMPTIDSANHIRTYGSRGKYDVLEGANDSMSGFEGLTALDTEGNLKEEVKIIISLIAEYDVILGTGHLSIPEIYTVVKFAKEVGVKRVLITHPLLKTQSMSAEQVKELTDMGAMAEYCYVCVSPMWAYAKLKETCHHLRYVGPDKCILSSDTGQRHNPMPPDSLRTFAQCVYESGFDKESVYRMIIDNPKYLLNI